MIEKTDRSEMVYEGNFLKIQKDVVELPNGKKTNREFILHPGASLVVPIYDDYRTLLLKQYRHPLKKVFWEFPAGKKDPGEDALTTAKRELFEETGIRAKKWIWLTDIHPAIGYANEVIHLFIAKDLTEEPPPENGEEFLELTKISFQEIEKLIQNHEVSDVKTLVAYFWADKYLRGEWKASEQQKK